jgi:hypothetical protein
MFPHWNIHKYTWTSPDGKGQNQIETWSLTLRVRHRLRVFEYMVIRKILGPKRYEGTGGWKKKKGLRSGFIICFLPRQRGCDGQGM